MVDPLLVNLQPTPIVGSNATLATALVSGTPYTSLGVTALKVAIASGDVVTLVSGAQQQTTTASALSLVGATSIAVSSFSANFSYPIGTFVDPTYVPESSVAPGSYISGANAVAWLVSRWPQFATNPNGSALPVAEGLALAASMIVDEEGPFFGVKFVVTQEREWPRTFKYGWPNMIATPSPVLVTEQRPGSFFLNYEGVVPDQIMDCVCLEYYRMAVLRPDVEVESEGVTGASVHYNHWTGQKGSVPAQLDRIIASLLSTFQVQSAHTDAFMGLVN